MIFDEHNVNVKRFLQNFRQIDIQKLFRNCWPSEARPTSVL